jgi:hypothetical protein
VWGFGATEAWAAGTDALLYRFAAGIGWVPVVAADIPWYSATHRTMYGMWGNDPNTVWVVGTAGVAYLWNGTVWNARFASGPANNNNLNGVCGLRPNAVWAVGVTGAGVAVTIVRWNGGTWTAESAPVTGVELNDCWALNDDNVWAVGADGTILHRDVSGVWMASSSGTTQTLSGVWGSPDTPTFAVGNGGTILRHTVGGWVAEPSPTAIDLTAIHGRGGTAPLAVAVDRLGDVWRWHPQR